MHPTTITGTQEGGGDGAPDARGDRSAEEDRRAGTPEGESASSGGATPGGDGEHGQSPTAPADDDLAGARGGEEGEGDSEAAEPGVPATYTRRARITDREIEIAIKAAKGNIALASVALGKDKGQIAKRIKGIPHLHALYGGQMANEGIVPPTEAETMLRRPDQLPIAPSDPQLGKMVIATEKLIRDGLDKLGVPQTTIDKLKAFDGLAIGAGAFLAQSLQDTHQIYYVNLMRLDARAEEIYRRYLIEDAPEKPDPMAQMFWQRAYNEIVEQLGKGHDRMLAGTQAMVAMMKRQQDGGDKGTKGPKAKPDF